MESILLRSLKRLPIEIRFIINSYVELSPGGKQINLWSSIHPIRQYYVLHTSTLSSDSDGFLAWSSHKDTIANGYLLDLCRERLLRSEHMCVGNPSLSVRVKWYVDSDKGSAYYSIAGNWKALRDLECIEQ